MIRAFLPIIAALCLFGSAWGATEFKVGLFQAGDFTPHGQLRESFNRSLKLIAPPDTTFVFQANAFKSAQWNRETSRTMARELVAMRELDIIVTIGPWVVEDLIAAGFTKPIVALYRTDPVLEGIADSTSRPRYKNLTVQAVPNRINADITLLHRLKPFKKLGLLYFPSGADSTMVTRYVTSLTRQLGAETVTAYGYNNIGTYAYLKAYSELPADIDAIYCLPLWGLDADKIRELGQRFSTDRKISAAWDGYYAVDKGFLVSTAGFPSEAEGRFAAWKMVQIARGRSPQSLPTELPFIADLNINAQTAARFNIDVTLEMITQADMVKVVEESSPRLTLTETTQRALDMNPGKLAWDEAVAASRARASAAKSEYYPKAYIDGSVKYVDDNRLSNERSIVSEPELIKNDRYRAALTIEQQIFSRETTTASKIAENETAVRSSQADSVRSNLETEVTRAFFSALEADEMLGVERRHLQLVNHGAELARGMLASSERDRFDITRWQIEELSARQSIAETDAARGIARIYLNGLLNQPGEIPLQFDTTAWTPDAFWKAYERIRPYIVTETARKKTTGQLLNYALASSYSLRVAATAIEAQRARLSSVWSSLYPTVGMRASFALTDELDDTPLYAEKENSWSVGAFLRWSIFDGGRRGKESRAAKYRLSELEYVKDQAGIELMTRISTLVEQIATSATQVLTAEQETESSTAFVSAALDRYSSGKESQFAAIDAGRLARDAQIKLISARFTFFEQLTRLACEAGWSPHAEGSSAADLLHRKLSASATP